MLRIAAIVLAVAVAVTEAGDCSGDCTTPTGTVCGDWNTHAACLATDTTNNPCDVPVAFTGLSCTPPAITDACACQFTFYSSVGATAAQRCALYPALIDCLTPATPLTGNACGSQTIAQLAASLVVSMGTGTGKDNCLPGTATCDGCKRTYKLAKLQAADNTAKCTALNEYIDCLSSLTSVSTQGVCLNAAATAEIAADNTAASCSTGETATCTCVKAYLTGDLTQATTRCTKNDALVTCLGAITTTTEKSCLASGTPTQASLKTVADAYKASTECSSTGGGGNNGQGRLAFGLASLIFPLLAVVYM